MYKTSRACRVCCNCQLMSSPKSTYNQLMNIDSKYLKLYLQYTNENNNEIDINQVDDKFKLVELVINSNSKPIVNNNKMLLVK